MTIFAACLSRFFVLVYNVLICYLPSRVYLKLTCRIKESRVSHFVLKKDKSKSVPYSPLRKLATLAAPLSARKISYDSKQAVEGVCNGFRHAAATC